MRTKIAFLFIYVARESSSSFLRRNVKFLVLFSPASHIRRKTCTLVTAPTGWKQPPQQLVCSVPAGNNKTCSSYFSVYRLETLPAARFCWFTCWKQTQEGLRELMMILHVFGEKLSASLLMYTHTHKTCVQIVDLDSS